MDGHPQAMVVLFPCSLAMQGVKEATMENIVSLFVCVLVCLFVCLLVCLYVVPAPRSISNGRSVAYMVHLPHVWLELG